MVTKRSPITGPMRKKTTTAATAVTPSPMNPTLALARTPGMNARPTVAPNRSCTTGPLLPEAAIPAPRTTNAAAATTRHRA